MIGRLSSEAAGTIRAWYTCCRNSLRICSGHRNGPAPALLKRVPIHFKHRIIRYQIFQQDQAPDILPSPKKEKSSQRGAHESNGNSQAADDEKLEA